MQEYNPKINVNITTWKERDWCVPIMLDNLKKQTMKADNIFIWLSRTEYNDVVPSVIRKYMDDNVGMNIHIKWVEGNSYAHKRYDFAKYFNDDYNITLDDDILYWPTLIDELYNSSLNYSDCVNVFSSHSSDYVGVKRVILAPKLIPSLLNNFMGGLSCFPPRVFPIKSFEKEDLRDKYCTRCDESWLTANFIKQNIKINVIHNLSEYKLHVIPNTQDVATYSKISKTNAYGIREREVMFANAIKIVGCEKEAKAIWPNFDIDKCATFGCYNCE